MIASDNFFFVRVRTEQIINAEIFDACAVNYLWGPKSNSWGLFKKQFKNPRVQSKEEGMAWGIGYGLLQVNPCEITKFCVYIKDYINWTKEGFIKVHARDAFREYLCDFVKSKIYLIKKTGILTLTTDTPKFKWVGEKVQCSAKVGLWFVPMPLKDLLRMYKDTYHNEWYPDWIIDSKRALIPIVTSDIWFGK